MDMTNMVVILSLITMLLVIVFALVSKARIKARMADPKASKSSLARDGNSHRAVD